MRPDALRRASQAKIMSQAGAGKHSQNKHSRIAVAFATHEQLSSRTPPGQGKAKPAMSMPAKFQNHMVWATGCPSKPGLNWPRAMLVAKAATSKATKP